MPNFEENARRYQEQIKASLDKKLPSKEVYIPFHAIKNTNTQVFLNPALDAQAVKPANYKNRPLVRVDAVMTADGVKDEMIRRPAEGETCVIDWLTLTMPTHVLENDRTNSQLHASFKQTELINNLSDVLNDLLGFAIESENRAGRNFYERSYTLEKNAGYVCIGGQNDTVMICINGIGCTYGKQGWEEHLEIWLSMFAPHAKITRIDLAHDDIEGKYTNIDWFNEQHTDGGFTRGGRPPICEYRGDWKNPTGKGRTLYIGSRQSSKFCRIYEKGKQLGDSNSEWLRTEVEYKSKDIFIDKEVLLNPSEYFSITYPCFDVFEFNGHVKKFDRIEQQNLMTFAQGLGLVKNQYGRYLYFYRKYFKDAQLLDILTDIENTKPPERIDPLTIPQLSHSAGA